MAQKALDQYHHFNGRDHTSVGEVRALASCLLHTEFNISGILSGGIKRIRLSDLGWSFAYNHRRRSAGLCDYSRKTIYVSKWLLEQNLQQALAFENVIRHEIAHAIDFQLTGKSSHGPIWQAIAQRVLCDAERCYNPAVIKTKRLTKYSLVCPSCGTRYPSHKINRVEKACRKCCEAHNEGRFSPKFKLEQVQHY